jgi:hypothetical protein
MSTPDPVPLSSAQKLADFDPVVHGGEAMVTGLIGDEVLGWGKETYALVREPALRQDSPTAARAC